MTKDYKYIFENSNLTDSLNNSKFLFQSNFKLHRSIAIFFLINAQKHIKKLTKFSNKESMKNKKESLSKK